MLFICTKLQFELRWKGYGLTLILTTVVLEVTDFENSVTNLRRN